MYLTLQPSMVRQAHHERVNIFFLKRLQKKDKCSKQVESVWRKIKIRLGIAEILPQNRLYPFDNEELIIRDFFQDRQGLFFVDVGCAWPVKASNTYYLEKHLGWTGSA